MTDGNARARDQIVTEAKRLAVDVLYSEKGHFEAAKRWATVNLWIGVPSTFLAAAAGGTFFAGAGPALPGFLAFSASALSAIATFLDPNGVTARHHHAGILYGRARRLLRQFVHIDVSLTSNDAELAKQLKVLTDQVGDIQADSPRIPEFARKLAKADIDSGSADYTSKELALGVGEREPAAPELSRGPTA
jgi:hypothetical protein